MQPSTLKKLSETLGLSVSTVSRALKDHPDISEQTKRKVKELAELMEYEPNSYAIQLRTKQSNVLGLMVPSVDNFFYDSFIAAVEEDARLHGYTVLIMQSRDKLEIESSNLQVFRKNMVMGLFVAISIETDDIAPFQKFKDKDVPVVFFDRVPENEGFHKVCLEDRVSARMAAEIIVAKKKKNVLALFGHPHLSISKIRCASFKETMERLAPGTPVVIDYPENIMPSKKRTLEALKGENPPDVIFCMGDLILIGVMYAIHEMKLRVPEDIAVVSISNGLIPTMYDPKVTHVETNGFKLGKLAFSQMLSTLRDRNAPEEVFLKAVLVEGGSI